MKQLNKFLQYSFYHQRALSEGGWWWCDVSISLFSQSQELMQKSQPELHSRSVKLSIVPQVTLPHLINQCISD